MFVKIVHYELEKEGSSPRCIVVSHEATYECARVYFKDWHTYPPGFVVKMEGPHGGDIEVQLEKKLVSIYVMNDGGKTIDRHQF